nr:hypothetical protein [Tanacetum cinerariifolium]
MSFQRSGEDHVIHISKSIFVTNFQKTADLVICGRCVRAMGRWSMFIFPIVGLNQANVVRYERASKNVKSTSNPAFNVQGNKGSYATAVRGTVPLTA